MNAPLHHPVIPAAAFERQETATTAYSWHVVTVAGKTVEVFAALITTHFSRLDTYAVEKHGQRARVCYVHTSILPPTEAQIDAALGRDSAPPIIVDLDLPDGFSDAYPGADLLTLGVLNAERRAAEDARFDGRRDRQWMAQGGD